MHLAHDMEAHKTNDGAQCTTNHANATLPSRKIDPATMERGGLTDSAMERGLTDSFEVLPHTHIETSEWWLFGNLQPLGRRYR